MATADPTAAIDSAETAYAVACKLLNAAGDDPDAAFWRTCAAAPLAALLYRASPAGTGGGLDRVRKVLAMPWLDTVTAVVDNLTSTTDPNVAYLQNAWAFATRMDPAQAASIQLVIREAIAPYAGAPS